jgi:vacuolar-type H+-ATPase subunit E/Vma4
MTLQCELESLQSSIKRAEVNLQASNMKVERLEKVLTDILYQVGDLISAVQNNSKTNSEHNQAVCIEPYLQI